MTINTQQHAEKVLSEGLIALNVSQQYHQPLLDYLLLLKKWNQAYNLTAVRDLDAMVTRHVLDSLAIIPYVQGLQLLDVGSGAGLPGIPLAITCPSLAIMVMDSNGKKTRFLSEVKRALNLTNVTVVHARVENYHDNGAFDTVVSRAFSELQQLIEWTHHLVAEDGRWLAMKGHYPTTELTAINYPYDVHTYQVPGLDGQRCAVIIKKQ